MKDSSGKPSLSPDSHMVSIPEILHKLRGDERLDWAQYLKENQDVAASHMDPVEHFVYFGAKEGRKAPFGAPRHPHRLMPDSSPVLSVVIYDLRDDLFLDKSLRSCIAQVSRRLEVIVLSRAERPIGIETKTRYQEAGIRIAFEVSHDSYGSATLFRQALILSKADYLLFINSGDFLDKHLCENFEKISVSWPDVAILNTTLLNLSREGVTVDEMRMKSVNTNCALELTGFQIMEAAYGTGTLPPALPAKVYKKSLIEEALKLFSGLSSFANHIYFPLALMCCANSLKVAKDCTLYLLDSEIIDSNRAELCSISEAKLYLENCYKLLLGRKKQQYFDKFLDTTLKDLLNSLIYQTKDSKDISLDLIIGHFGLMPVLKSLVEKYLYSWEKVANITKFSLQLNSGLKPHSKIGIIYPVLLNGGAEKVIIEFCKLLCSHGHKVVLFLERPSPNEEELNEGIEIKYVGAASYNARDAYARLYQLHNYVAHDHFDLMVSHAYWSPSLLWETILFHSLGLPYLVFQHSAFYRRLITGDKGYGILENEAVLRCVDKLFVLSVYDETYLRLRGIDAIYLPNPVKGRGERTRKLSHNILFCGRLGEPVKQAAHALQICWNIAKEFPDVKMIFAGEFRHAQDREKFCASIHELGLDAHISITGWQEDLSPLYQECSIFLSTSFTESFGLALAEAQAHGLPCVIYEMPIMPAYQNESIITVPLGQYELAAERICSLYREPDKWRSLSKIAIEKSERFSKAIWNVQVLEALSGFPISSPWAPPDERIYRKIIKALTFYACATPPRF